MKSRRLRLLDRQVVQRCCQTTIVPGLLDEGLADYVTMDVKAPLEKYPLLAGRADLDVARLEQSAALLQGGALSYEFRTTVVPGWLDEGDVEEIARWIAGAEWTWSRRASPT